jgi:hypothetical protein
LSILSSGTTIEEGRLDAPATRPVALVNQEELPGIRVAGE